MKNLCIIPARGGSKRIPGKNIRDFLGKPIIAYSIETALQCGLFDVVMVSTDDAEIAAVAKAYGAKVPFMRSAENADDHATLADVVEEVLGHYNGQFDYACCILPTAPLLQSRHLKAALQTMRDKGFDSVRPVVKFAYPIQRALQMDKDGAVKWFNPEYARTRSQDLEPAFHDAGQFYWMDANLGLSPEKRGAILLTEIEVQDIDNEDDWRLAELKYRMLSKMKTFSNSTSR